mgnify:CR=1 FL=1
MESLIQIISTLGFPIAVSVALFWYMVTEQKELRAVIDNNSNILLRILEHFKQDDEK